ncbi:MAG: hypothetical protein LIO65_01165 [Odoribacter sp.]|nr:hypothetical protein [Odoribacter sp.]
MKIIKDFILNIKRFKITGILNILGLAVAFTAFAVILFQLSFELGYDKHYAKSDRIYRVETLYPISLDYVATSPVPIGGLIKESSPLIENFFRYENNGSGLVRTIINGVKGEKYKEQFVKATPSIIDILDINILEGDGK